jgi:WD40 repeat protein
MSGRVLFYKIDPNSDFSQFDFIEELKYHPSSVTGIAINPDNNSLFSCDDNGNFYFGVLDMIHKKNYCPQLINQSAKGYSKLYYEIENERLYLSTINGHLEVYLTSSSSPSFVTDIITDSSMNYSLNDLVPYMLKHYLFSCSDKGYISVFDLGKKGQEKITKELSFFNYYGAKFQMKTIIYDPDTNEVITGDDQGRIIFWSLKYGKPIHVTRVSKKKKCIKKIRFVENSEENNKLLFVSCMDNGVYFIRLPLKWLNNDDIEKYELIEIKSRSDLDAMMKIQELLNKNEDYNSDEDSLNGWDYFANDAVEESNNKNK